MSNAIKFMIFTTGVAMGSMVTWYLTKKKYEQIAQGEIDSVKEVFAKRTGDPINDEEVDPNEGQENKEYSSLMRKHNYTSYSENGDKDEKVAENNPENTDHPYTISPHRFGEIDYYESISLTYYSDNVLVDNEDNKIDNYKDIVGQDFAKSFGEYEEDAVFIRNDRLKCDYEILRDQQKYYDVILKNLHQLED